MLRVSSVSRTFGDRRVLDDISFDVSPGSMTGFVGANGAGKTTSMRIILGLLSADSGEVTWNGQPVSRVARQRFGYMPEERGLYPKMKVREQLVYLGRLHGLTTAAARGSADELLERVGLTERANDAVETLSLGNQQRAQIAAALVHEPELLILDEPFSGLDPVAVDAVAGVLREHTVRGVPVLFSSHQLDVVERLCDDLVIIAAGAVRASGSRAELRTKYATQRYELVLDVDAGWIRDLSGVSIVDLDAGRAVIDIADPDGDQAVLRAALRRGPVRAFGPVIPSLAEIFREVTQ
jgi:ABC-2 type transport system ATP-binding protein